MNYDFPLWQPSRNYICPPDALPAWREAYEAGYDMAAIEDSLKVSPEERLHIHGRMMANFFKREEFFETLRCGRNLIHRIESSRNNQKPTN